jgi:uncharacterized protein (TIGR02391 family)
MPTLPQLIPDANVLLGLAPEELAFYVLRAARSAEQNGLLNLQPVVNDAQGAIGIAHGRGGGVYPQAQMAEIEVALTEAWAWLESQLFIVPAPGINGTHGWKVLGRRGKGLEDERQFTAIRKASAFPRELLHPAIAERAWISIMRGEFDAAVLFAFRAVEEAVRDAGGFQATDIGVNLMRRAFSPANGPLSDMTQPEPEREALMHLFAGAIGSYKNPHSHRTVVIQDASEAQEQVMLASHLLRIVASRGR